MLLAYMRLLNSNGFAGSNANTSEGIDFVKHGGLLAGSRSSLNVEGVPGANSAAHNACLPLDTSPRRMQASARFALASSSSSLLTCWRRGRLSTDPDVRASRMRPAHSWF